MALDFSINIKLENDRVELFPLREMYFSALEEICEDPFIWYYFFERGETPEELKNYLGNAMVKRELQKEYPFVVFDKLKKKVAGMTRLHAYSEELKTIKIGHTWYGKDFRETGLNKHCKYVLFEFLFDLLKIERIGFGIYKGNDVSAAALKSVGCQEEGVLRGMFPSLEGRGRVDAVLFSVLKTDWEQKIKKKLKNKLI